MDRAEGQRITDEINADPEEVCKLRRAQAQARAGLTRPLHPSAIWYVARQRWYIDYEGWPAEIGDPLQTYTLHQLMVMTPILQKRGYTKIVFSTWNPRA